MCACARPGGGVGDCALMPSAALTCSWESRGKSEQSCSAPTESEEGRSQQPDPKTGITLQPGGRVPNLASLCPSFCPRPLGSLATMRSDFALVLTAALLLDVFWVRFSVSRCAFYPRGVAGSGRILFQSAGVGRKRQNKKSAADSVASSRTSALIGPLTILREPELTAHPCPL